MVLEYHAIIQKLQFIFLTFVKEDKSHTNSFNNFVETD